MARNYLRVTLNTILFIHWSERFGQQKQRLPWYRPSVWMALVGSIQQESCAIAKMTAQCAIYMGALKIFGTPWLRPRHYSQHFHWLLFQSTLWMFLQNLKSVALPVPEIIWGTQKIWTVPGYAHSPFSPKFLMGFYSDGPCKYTRQIWSP